MNWLRFGGVCLAALAMALDFGAAAGCATIWALLLLLEISENTKKGGYL